MGDVRKSCGRRGRKKIYTAEVKKALIKVWYIMDCICGKRLAAVMKEIVKRLEFFGEISLNEETREKLLIRTFSDWDEGRPGFVEIDLVGHDGGDGRGEFMQTLDVTDVYTTWTETQAVKNKAQVWVFEALKDIRQRMPFELLGIDSDSGPEFINHELYRYCQQEGITFTRSRSYRKNDNCFVEQKNYSVVRRAVGYFRYDTEEELKVVNELYQYLRLYTNFFQPTMKLIEKTRIGSKVIKKHDRATTPYQRVLNCPEIPETVKRRLKRQYSKLNPASLKRKITRLQDKLIRMATNKSRKNRSVA